MTDILLTHSYHLANDPKQLRKMQPYAPLGTLYAAAALRDSGVSVTVFDTTLKNPLRSLKTVLNRENPKVLVIYEDDFNFLSKMCLLSMRQTAEQIARLGKAAGAVVVGHGSDETDFAEEYLKAGVDYILTGEAEGTLTELCHALLANQDPSGIPGLIWKDTAGSLHRSGSNPVRNSDWSKMPLPARDLIDMGLYRDAWTDAHGRFSANVVASRGCPYSCNWCAKPISGNKYQLRPAADVARELRDLKLYYGAEHIWFSDDIFALNRHWLHDFARWVHTYEAVIPYKIQARADLLREDVVSLLAESGCDEVWMGVESGSQKVLDAMDKRLQVSDVVAATTHLRTAGIKACFFLQLGYPGEGWRELLETVALVRATRPDDIGVSISYPLPGTVFYERVQAELAAKRNWKDSDDLCVMFSGAYSDSFYRTIRDALHLEVSGWKSGSDHEPQVDAMWKHIAALEPQERRDIEHILQPRSSKDSASFLPLHALTPAGGAV
ncbi:B12-binding domain-containing radical SAM protein [Terriglobus albidus]|uniref:B12-binding domain-containing radical SAM protein n=1 Tax=Terriglobus albidus TaxID=1592106 RepID=UPI0021E0FC71|nr:radical SAM protein [Terriglobus albidus]